MDGITVLSESFILIPNTSFVRIVLFTILLGVGISVFGGIIEKTSISILGLLISFGSLIIGLTAPADLDYVASDIVEQKVLISEDVSFVEFNKRYNFINQEGDIYTVTIKKNVE